MKEITVCKTFTFAAGHHLPYHKGLCQRPHGHNYRLEVEVAGAIKAEANNYNCKDISQTGMIIDFGQLKDVVGRLVIDRYDHTGLNDRFPNPTAEIMVEAIFARLKLELWDEYKLHLKRVRLWETDTSWAQVESN
ncbi:hypothetical protein LCGC14_0569350 [marine sediment metagenome]|uniref:6-carboxy-5,6,7,8-tetrahydropterin synthase n=1 Tax=marine sediment metagenome TaxID=412755 RepID=A0A0F9U5X8_9ZZZZ